MKKGLKITLIVLDILLGIIVLDTLQAKIFDNSPIFKIRENYDKGLIDYIDRGLLVNHYKYVNGNEMTIFFWENTTY